MIYNVQAPSSIDTAIDLPSSKSESNRWLILNALSGGKLLIENLSSADDTKLLAELLQITPEIVHTENCGTAMRFLAAYLCLQDGNYFLTGSARMLRRPIGPLVDGLRQVGAEIDYAGEENFPPLKVRGKALTGGSVEINSKASSQFVSAMLLIAPFLPKGLCIKFMGEVVSRPYIELTLKQLEKIGASVMRGSDYLQVAPSSINSTSVHVGGDWSIASYWYAIAALLGSSRIVLNGLRLNGWQGDQKVAEIYTGLGVQTKKVTGGVILSSIPSKTDVFRFNGKDQPDLVPTLICTCLGLGIAATIEGVEHLRIKESNRIDSLIGESQKCGAKIHYENGVLTLEQPEERASFSLGERAIETYGDHRIAMSFATLASKWNSINIKNPSVVSKSYPSFWSDLKKAGFSINEVKD